MLLDYFYKIQHTFSVMNIILDQPFDIHTHYVITSYSIHYTKLYDSETESVSKANTLGTLAKTVGSVALGALSVATAPLTGGASVAVAGGIVAGQIALGAYIPSTKTKGHAVNENYSENEAYNEGEAFGENESQSENETHTRSLTSGKSENMQLTMQNKTLLNTLDRNNFV